jgi:Protein of unknown function (DUF2946)
MLRGARHGKAIKQPAGRAYWKNFSILRLSLSIDVIVGHVDNRPMVKLLPILQKMPRTLLPSVVVSLFLLQTMAFVFSSAGRAAFSSGVAGASIAMAGEICRAKSDDGGKAPAQPSHHHHCALCSVGNDDDVVDVVADFAKVIIVLTPRSGDAPAWFVQDYPAPSPLGWTSSWSSRAPPVLS